MEQCRSCGQEVELNTSVRGTLLVVYGTCPDGHVLNWHSQPLVRDMGAGNLMVAAAILFCSLTFTGISNLAKLLNLEMFSESSFYGLQKEYLFPVIHTNYVMQQNAVLEFLRGTNYNCLVMVDVTVQGIVLNTVHTHLWTQPLTSF